MPVTFSPATRQDRISVFSTMEIERTLRFVMWGYAAPTLDDWMDVTESLEMYIGSDEQGFAMATWAFPCRGVLFPYILLGRAVFLAWLMSTLALCAACGSMPTRRQHASLVLHPDLLVMCSGTP